MATLKVLIVEPDSTVRETEIENDLGTFQAVVGGYLEVVLGNVATIYVNEEDLLRRLPFNPLATAFAQRILGHESIYLVGRALIVGPPADGDDTDVRPAVVDYFKEN